MIVSSIYSTSKMALERNMIANSFYVIQRLLLWLKVILKLILKVNPMEQTYDAQNQSEEIIVAIPDIKNNFILIYCKKYMCERISSVTNKIFKIFSILSFYGSGVRLKRIIGGKIRNKLKNRYNINVKLPFTITNMRMISITICLLLLCQGVESNPGPAPSTEIMTYNCNGLGDQRKLRRLLTKLDKKVNKGAIIFLQETHIVNTAYLDAIWKNKYLSNGRRTNAAGVMILFNEKYEIKYEFRDNEGRQIIAVLNYDGKNTIIANAYFPNDHKEGINFAEDMYRRILEVQAEFPESSTICAGDYNVCLTTEDSMGRVGSHTEKMLAEVIQNNNEVTELSDAYRSIHKKEGFTWKRGNIYSRLDYIFISTCEVQKIVEANTDWAFEASDHAAVSIRVRTEEMKKGPGIVKVNAEILEDPKMVEEISNEVKEMLGQTDESWSPHAILEFLKVSIRSIIAAKISDRRRQTRDSLCEKEDELNQMENLKIKIHTNKKISEENKSERLKIMDVAILNLKSSVQSLRRDLNNKMTFYSQAKWFEYGEKSNKFFLNLNKKRQNQKIISKISDGENVYFGQEQTSKGITNFYRNLYKKKPRNEDENNHNFYDNCPKLSDKHKEYMEKDLSLQDLKEALVTCNDSAPGPDGIPYGVYRKLWNLAGPIILKAWQHSLEVGKLPPSHLESVITLLPKEGKDVNDIKNWRPITLSNCDAKIITKAIAIKTSKILDSIIDVSQTAYVPGRSITDNLRSNSFYKNYCKKKNIDAALISLDAKKAFDSVDHKYIEETLVAYGFGPIFIKIFKTLYRDITARILINGFTSETINIERGVKQGDALSCALFIICIDPLLRNINKNENIKQVKILRQGVLKKKIDLKAAAYADDISVICEKDGRSIQMVFNEYEKLTRLSGLELNADKTEILVLNKMTSEEFIIKYRGETINITSITKMKICGIYFCTDSRLEYKLNVLDKIDKLSYKIKAWIPRYLTLEGKALIVKTYGLSQIIYNMQAIAFEDQEIITIERIIFKFLWSTTENHDGIDRVKRSIMKNDYKHGGMKITDVECLNRSLKLRQFIRSQQSSHVIARIQNLLSKNNDKNETETSTLQEYCKITNEEPICQSAQESLNLITDFNREQYKSINEEDFETDKLLINEISSINLSIYLRRKKHLFMACMLKPLETRGISSLGELVQNYEYEIDEKILKSMKLIMSCFPENLIKISKCFIEGINTIEETLNFIRIEENTWKSIDSVTAKEFQVVMKKILKKTEVTNFNQKLDIPDFNVENITKLRKKCQNSKLRNIYFRLIHNDFFTHVRMKKYKMCQTDCCPRCGSIETSRHLLFDCLHAKNIWNLYNQIVTENTVTKYEDLFHVGDSQSATTIKMKIIQELIQIERPKLWNIENIKTIIKNLLDIERFNAFRENKVQKFKKIWLKYERLTLT